MSQWVKFIQCAWHLPRLFDLVRWPRGLHGSRLLSAGNLSHHLPVRGLPRPPGHHPGDTAVLHSKQTTDFLRTSALPGGQGQHPRHPRRQPLWWKVSHLRHVCLFCPFLLHQFPIIFILKSGQLRIQKFIFQILIKVLNQGYVIKSCMFVFGWPCFVWWRKWGWNHPIRLLTVEKVQDMIFICWWIVQQ